MTEIPNWLFGLLVGVTVTTFGLIIYVWIGLILNQIRLNRKRRQLHKAIDKLFIILGEDTRVMTPSQPPSGFLVSKKDEVSS